jgi:Domain of unknown function (DUF202)
VDRKTENDVSGNFEGVKMLDQEKSGAGIEPIGEIDFNQELKLADKLAIERTVLAADRTMLAGVRTSMAFIDFGFTIFNVSEVCARAFSGQSHNAASDAKEHWRLHAARGNHPLIRHDHSVFPDIEAAGQERESLQQP